MIGLQRSTVSPCSSSIRRSTPWVLGCAGPMLRIIVWSSSGSSGRSPSWAASASLIRSTAPSSRISSLAVTSERGLSSWDSSAVWRTIASCDSVCVTSRHELASLNCTGIEPTS